MFPIDRVNYSDPRPNFLRTLGLCVALGCAGPPAPEQPPGDAEELTERQIIEQLAAELAVMTSRRWAGPRTDAPAPTSRPEAAFFVDSLRRPLRVHAAPGVSPARAAQTLESLEAFVDYLERGGWPTPYFDAGLGGADGFDFYLTPTDELAGAFSDGLLLWSFLDGASSFAVMDPDVSRLDSCVAAAYTEALTLQLDPAEARAWRRATAAWLSWHWTGHFGCADAAERQQAEPWRSWIHGAADDGAGGALMMAMISDVHDEGSGVFWRELWQLTRQRTWEGIGLRASPDLWESLDKALEVASDRLHTQVEEVAVGRYFAGESRDQHAHYRSMRGLGEGFEVPVLYRANLAELPEHTAASEEIETYGTIYAVVDVRGAPPQSRLRVWLRGEYGVEWALTGSRLVGGEEKARLSAPPRRGDRRSYLPVELTEDTEEVLVTATNLSHRLPDADDLDPNSRALRMIFDLIEEGEEGEE